MASFEKARRTEQTTDSMLVDPMMGGAFLNTGMFARCSSCLPWTERLCTIDQEESHFL